MPSSPSQGPFERRGLGEHRHLRRGLLRLGLRHGFGRAQQRRHVGQAGFIAIADDPPALTRLVHGGAADRCRWRGRRRAGRRRRARPGERRFPPCRVPGRVASACSRASASRALSANPRNRLMRATAPTTQLEARAVPGAAVEFPATLRRHLREKGGARRRLGRTGELFLQRRELHVGPVLDAPPLRAPRDRWRRSRPPRAQRSSSEGLAQWLAHQLIELRAGNPLVGRARICCSRVRDRWTSSCRTSASVTSPASRRLPASSRSARAVSAAASADWRGGRRDEHASVGRGHARGQIVVDHQRDWPSPSRGRCRPRRRSLAWRRRTATARPSRRSESCRGRRDD